MSGSILRRPLPARALRACALRACALRAQGLSVGWPGRTVLTGIDLDIEPGEVLAIIGPNGAGKTTLIRTLAGDLAPLAGRALVEEVPLGGLRSIGSIPRSERARIVARVLQSEEPAWPLPVREYVEAGTFPSTGWFGGLGHDERASVEAALASMDLLDLADRPVTELSGGEFRRVLVARALAQRPSVLLLDEPAADLDLARQVEILGTLRQLAASGMAVALSLHDLNLASLAADRVALIAGGRLAAIGSPREVITAEAVAMAYGAAVLVGDHPLGDFPHVIHVPDWLGRGAQKEDIDG
ncbi:MAG TPA: ABC transporter ATP-binding protein [Rectinemataceae bacterium]|nr:ABC transporter ATP-binding protein [Rectinemataceae bacterium]